MNDGKSVLVSPDWLPDAARRLIVSKTPAAATMWDNNGLRYFVEMGIVPQDAPLMMRIGWYFHLHDRLSEAVACWQCAARLDPALTYAWCLLGDHFTNIVEDDALAAVYYRTATESDPSCASAYSGLGLALYNLRELSGAAAAE